tara:strand:- start:514 stop:1146 length:633 start_codon:yes stop_codon:yes gene_type:complete
MTPNEAKLPPHSIEAEQSFKCKARDCDRPAKVIGFCTKHYQRFRKYGNPFVVKKGGYKSRHLSQRASDYVQKTPNGCWLWNGPMRSSGYGYLEVKGKKISMHRYFYEKNVGAIPDKYVIRHTCDNPRCVNPNHLLAGTPADNSRDMVIRNRSAKGENVATAVLTSKDVLAIRKSNKPNTYWARRLGVCKSTIRYARIGETWKHLEVDNAR